jgi:prepilin-type N-terminal cleavage/methylation domain-containing protein
MQRQRRDRAGFTLVEVMIALAMFAVLILALMSLSGKMVRDVALDRQRTLGAAAADARIALLRQWPDYAGLDAFAVGEADTPLPGWTRTTTVSRMGGPGTPSDYKRITVQVTGPGMSVPVSRTISLAAP